MAIHPGAMPGHVGLCHTCLACPLLECINSQMAGRRHQRRRVPRCCAALPLRSFGKHFDSLNNSANQSS